MKKTLPAIVLILGITSGQLLRVGVGGGGLIGLDLAAVFLLVFGLIKLNFKLSSFPNFVLSAILFSGMGVLALIFSPLHLTLSEKLISFSYNLRFLLYLFLGWIIYRDAFFLDREQTLTISASILAFAGILQVIFLPDLSFLQSQGWDPHYFRAVSTFLDPNFLGGFLSLALPLFLSRKMLPRLGFFLTYLGIVFTFSRSAAIFCIVTMATFSLLKKSKVLFELTFCLGLGFIIAFFLYHRFISQPRHIDRAASASFRLGTWSEGLAMLEHSPIFGVGFNSYRFALREFRLAPEQAIQSHGGTSNDSSLLYVADTTGVIGLTAYLGFMFSILGYAIRQYSSKNTWAIYTLSGMAGLLINSFFVNSLFYPPMLLWIFTTTSKLYKSG